MVEFSLAFVGNGRDFGGIVQPRLCIIGGWSWGGISSWVLMFLWEAHALQKHKLDGKVLREVPTAQCACVPPQKQREPWEGLKWINWGLIKRSWDDHWLENRQTCLNFNHVGKGHPWSTGWEDSSTPSQGSP